MSSASTTEDARTAAILAAEAAGFEVIIANARQLSIDLDAGADLNWTVYGQLCDLAKETPTIQAWTSKDGKGKHLLLTFANFVFTEAQACAIEGALGSDPSRTLFGTFRGDQRRQRGAAPVPADGEDEAGPRRAVRQDGQRRASAGVRGPGPIRGGSIVNAEKVAEQSVKLGCGCLFWTFAYLTFAAIIKVFVWILLTPWPTK